MNSDPIARFQDAFARAQQAVAYAASPLVPTSYDPTAMTLATVDADGQPSVRVVLLKGVDERGFVFYTNRQSRKGRALAANPRAALGFLFVPLAEQVRIEGRVEWVSDEESDAYFASRPRESQLGAWASQQSQPVGSRQELEAQLKAVADRHASGPVPRPPHWGGYRVVPDAIEFWKEGPYRIHDRDHYRRNPSGGWTVKRLQP
jgi:pyridoxamine 5'-phosphate oxidase